MWTVVNPDNTFSGVQYKEAKQEYISHHRQYCQKLVWCERKLTYDENGNVIETPTPGELASEITVDEKAAEAYYLLDLDFRLSILELGV